MLACRRAEEAKPDPTPTKDAGKVAPDPLPSGRALLHGNVVDLSTGAVVFPRATPARVRDEHADLFLGEDGQLRAVDLQSGKERWALAVRCAHFVVGSVTAACVDGGDLVIVERATGVLTRVALTPPFAVDDIIVSHDNFVLLQTLLVTVFDPRGAKRASGKLPVVPLYALSYGALALSRDGYCYVAFEAPEHVVRCYDLDTKLLRTTKVSLSRPGDPPYTRFAPLVLGPHHLLVGTFSFGGGGSVRRAAVVRLSDGALLTTVEDEVVSLAERGATLEGLVVAAPEIRYLDLAGKVRWKSVAAYAPPMLASLVDDDRLIVARYHPIATGVDVLALKLADGTTAWTGETKLPPIGHSKYRNQVTLEMQGVSVILRGHESSVDHVHQYDPRTGALRFHDAPLRY